MLSISTQRISQCDSVSRREWLRAGGIGSAGLMLPQLLRGRAIAQELGAAPGRPMDGVFGRAKSCILLFLFGAPAHQDLWDLKPEAPVDVRGEFRPIDSNVPGIWLGEHLPKTAQTAQRLAILRSVSHPDNTHTVAMHYMLTGQRHIRPATNPQNEPSDFPTFGAVLQHLRGGQRTLPAGISLNAPANQVSANNHIFPGFFAGWLGAAHDPLFIPNDPSGEDFRPFPSIEESAAGRFAQRRGLLAEVDARRAQLAAAAGERAYDRHYERAFQLVTSASARAAFDLSREQPTLREHYGRSPFGQGCLLARRLVEGGVPLVTVNWARDDAFWDTHKDNFNLLKNSLLPPFDAGYSALLEDLDQRGLLNETLVVCLGEFGRTPKINNVAGRDHWAACNSVVLAGAGIRGGQVVGASDRLAAYPATAPITPGDLAATIYHALGIDHHLELRDSLSRPHFLTTGRPLLELWA
ncbi:MAG: DUF1501 domain-containing protein [Pirellulales bacterium]